MLGRIFYILKYFIAFYGVIGTLSHSKIILELLLQNDKPQAFSEGGDPLVPPLTLIKNEGEELIRKGKEYF